MLYVLTRSGQNLLEWASTADKQELYMQVLESTICYKEHLDALRDFAMAAIARMMIAGEAAGL
jgi:hypothetical protein